MRARHKAGREAHLSHSHACSVVSEQDAPRDSPYGETPFPGDRSQQQRAPGPGSLRHTDAVTTSGSPTHSDAHRDRRGCLRPAANGDNPGPLAGPLGRPLLPSPLNTLPLASRGLTVSPPILRGGQVPPQHEVVQVVQVGGQRVEGLVVVPHLEERGRPRGSLSALCPRTPGARVGPQHVGAGRRVRPECSPPPQHVPSVWFTRQRGRIFPRNGTALCGRLAESREPGPPCSPPGREGNDI